MKPTLLISALVGALSSPVLAYELTAPSNQTISESQFRDAAGAPRVSFGKRNPECKEDCEQELIIGGYAHRFNSDAELLTVTRYQDRAFALVRQEHVKASGKRSSREDYHFVSGRNNQRLTKRILCEGSQATGFNYSGELVCLNQENIQIYTVNSAREITLPIESDFGQINNNLAGTLAIAFVNADKRTLHYTNLHTLDRQGDEAWQQLPTRLHNRSDRRDVIATYPVNRSTGLVAMYEYINPFNKGLTLYSFDKAETRRHVVTNSEDGSNFGFNPEVFVYGSQYAITAEDPKASKDEQHKTYLIDPERLLTEDTYHNELATQTKMEFLAGYGATYNFWHASQSIGDDIETDYDIEPSLLHSLYFQARYTDTQVSLKYLTNEVKESGSQAASDTVSLLTGLVDFNGFFEGADTLRLKMDWMTTSGTATYKSSRDSLCHNGSCEISKDFTTDYKNIETLVLSDGGYYMGLSYSTYAMPSAIGFTRDKESDYVLGAALDEDYEQSRIVFVVGSDEAAYGARYEIDYDRFYLRPNFGFGMVKHSFSKQAEQIARNGETGDIVGEYGMVLSGGLDAGYIYQRRWREASGLGFSIQGGVKANIEYTTTAPLIDASDDDIYFNSSRFDVMWGPYVQFNAIF
ncbi:hypothetical protein QTV44_000041 [Vibrio vulnificus]|nr:hypothetical protein [Vibrio vulnificus]